MFQKFNTTQYPPKIKPLLVWDGKCGFCKYWVTRWRKISEGKIDFDTYQNAAQDFPDIPLKEFKKASRLITTSGSVHGGPDSAYKSYEIANPSSPWHGWYTKYAWFRRLSDRGYNYIAKNRSTMFTITKAMLGSNPLRFRHYWTIYLFMFTLLLLVVLKFL